MTTARTLQDTPEMPTPGECWCCGTVQDPDQTVHLGNHPEVSLCKGCARWAAKQAWQIDDRSRSGPLVIARNRSRNARRAVIHRGWHRSPIIGAPLRWIGKRLP